MITEASIQEVRDRADLVEVIKKYAELKKRGANWVGCCPFHDEKTGSFHVSDSKEIYKCFGCGQSGRDAIRFIMEKERMEFPDAVKYLADWFNVTLQFTRSDDEEPNEVRVKKADYLAINKRAAQIYQARLMPLMKASPHNESEMTPQCELLSVRRLSLDSVVGFQLGWADQTGRMLSPLLIERALVAPAEELGLVKKGQNGTYDIYRSRIIFPIHNERGEIAGFGARILGPGEPKYLNSRDSAVYKKDQLLYGLYQAAASIRKMKFAVLVEGYYDVISLHQHGMGNTVGPCGTSFTEGQAKILRKYTNNILMMGDGDKAGKAANLKNVDMLLRLGFKVEVCELPKGEDPDSFCRSAGKGKVEETPEPAVENEEVKEEVTV